MTALLLVVAFTFMPSLLMVGLLWAYRKWQDREGRRSPIEKRAIYGAGEQLRVRMDKHMDQVMVSFVALFFMGPYFLAYWAMSRINLAQVRFGFGDYLLLVLFLIMVGAATWWLIKHGSARRIANAGLQAELYTAQELNRLMALGCTVLHDVPADGFNLDHVVIGPTAVYAVETKSVRKPAPTGGKDHFKVTYDGQCLRFPDFSDSKRLKQTRRQADWLAGHLRQALGRSIPVVPALALPGWWIETQTSAAATDLRVFNPAGRGSNFMADARGGHAIAPEIAALVVQALVMRYPTLGAKSS
ncbi:nuclease-related domain-containing protein [Agrilutibacter solisilvae]|uniref:NERD domain-containing protein n=1 Tax=Agrilutibacter solisilvae TaxID=2763317 RepID=A0A975ASN3_9GAMM|nr:nuclease-related domain-containing protein [Lysobacter solisilvae]QSX78937.1 NERD domain-containing protein [Lysobacter solisilvae]